MIIVCYMGGTAGDLVTAVIDDTDTILDDNKLIIHPDRSKLKKPHLFKTSEETIDYINTMGLKYRSLPSHSTDHHIEQNTEFITITVDNIELAKWAANRFKELHLPHVWEEVMRYSNITTVDEYAEMMLSYSNLVKKHTDKIINLKDILDGKLIEQLSEYTKLPLNVDLYNYWLSKRLNSK